MVLDCEETVQVIAAKEIERFVNNESKQKLRTSPNSRGRLRVSVPAGDDVGSDGPGAYLREGANGVSP